MVRADVAHAKNGAGCRSPLSSKIDQRFLPFGYWTGQHTFRLSDSVADHVVGSSLSRIQLVYATGR